MTETEFSNICLDAIGADRISALDDGTVNANRVALLLPLERDATLREHLWNFAIKRLTLVVTTAPIAGFTYAYERDNDDLRILSINEDPEAIWQVEGRTVVTDETTCVVKYIHRITNPTLWDPLFTSAFSLRLASKLALAVAHDMAYSIKLLEQYYAMIGQAQTIDGQEGSSDTIESTSLTTDIRDD